MTLNSQYYITSELNIMTFAGKDKLIYLRQTLKNSLQTY